MDQYIMAEKGEKRMYPVTLPRMLTPAFLVSCACAKQGLGLSMTFVLFACFGIVMALAVYLLLPETKGVALEDMDALFEEWRNPKKQKQQAAEGLSG